MNILNILVETIAEVARHPFVLLISTSLISYCFIIDKILPAKSLELKLEIIHYILETVDLIDEAEGIYSRRKNTLSRVDLQGEDWQEVINKEIPRLAEIVNVSIISKEKKLDRRMNLYFDLKKNSKIASSYSQYQEKLKELHQSLLNLAAGEDLVLDFEGFSQVQKALIDSIKEESTFLRGARTR